MKGLRHKTQKRLCDGYVQHNARGATETECPVIEPVHRARNQVDAARRGPTAYTNFLTAAGLF